MKHASIFFILITVFACNKTSDPGGIDPALLKGTWELRYWDFDTNPVYLYPPGNGHLLTLDGKNFKEYTQDTIFNSGTYEYLGLRSIGSSDCGIGNPPVQYMSFLQWTPNSVTLPGFFFLNKDTLTLSSGCFPLTARSGMGWVKVK